MEQVFFNVPLSKLEPVVKRWIREIHSEFQSEKVESTDHREVLTRKETAELLGVSLVTIHDWSRSGIIHPYKLGNRTYFKRSEIMEVLNQSNPKNHDRAK